MLKKLGSYPHAQLTATRSGYIVPKSLDNASPETNTPQEDQDAEALPSFPDDETLYQPHDAPRPQKSRHHKCWCETCGYTVRTAKKWILEKGEPHCPDNGEMTSDIGVKD